MKPAENSVPSNKAIPALSVLSQVIGSVEQDPPGADPKPLPLIMMVCDVELLMALTEVITGAAELFEQPVPLPTKTVHVPDATLLLKTKIDTESPFVRDPTVGDPS
jgi:hypothetical protein